MSIFSSDKAPYILALLVGVVGWFFTTAVTETKGRVFLHHDLKIDRSDPEASFAELALYNQSLEKVFEKVEVVLRCQGGEPCFRSPSDGAINDYMTAVATPPWAIDVVAEGTDAAQSMMPRIPAGASLVVRVALKTDAPPPELFFKVPDTVNVIPELSTGVSIYGLVLRHYLLILVAGGGLGTLVFIVWAWGGRTKDGETIAKP